MKIWIPALLLVLQAALVHSGAGAQNAPVSTAGTVSTYLNSITVPVTAVNLSDIGSFSLKITYDTLVAVPTAVTADPVLAGNLSVNLGIPGVVFVSWYAFTGVTLPGPNTILNISFNRVASGTTALGWLDEGISCAWYNSGGMSLNDLPASGYYINGSLSFLSTDAPHTVAPVLKACPNTFVSVPVRVTGFSGIGNIQLKMTYDPVAAGFTSFENTSGFPGLAAEGSQPGTVVITGMVPSGGFGFTLADSAVLFTLNFLYLGGSTGFNWADNGTSCQYGGAPPLYFTLGDTPQDQYYVNGFLTATDPPVIVAQPASPPAVSAGSGTAQFSVETSGAVTGYRWQELRQEWTDLADSGVYQGTHTAGLAIVNAPVSMNGLHYRCVITGICTTDLFTDGMARLTVSELTGTAEPEGSLNARLRVWPNPLTEGATVEYRLPERCRVTVELIEVTGSTLTVLADSQNEKGIQTLRISRGALRSGIYFLRMTARGPHTMLVNTVKLTVQ